MKLILIFSLIATLFVLFLILFLILLTGNTVGPKNGEYLKCMYILYNNFHCHFPSGVPLATFSRWIQRWNSLWENARKLVLRFGDQNMHYVHLWRLRW